MQHEAVNGVVVNVRNTGDHDIYLSLLTAEHGRITVLSKGGKSLRGSQMGLCQLYTYGNYEIYQRGSLYILKDGEPIRSFHELSEDLDRMNLAAYLCALVLELTDEGEEAPEMLRMLLNSLHAISRELYPQPIIKGAFEMRAAAISGYAPDLDACAFCGEKDGKELYLDVMNGALLCSDCLQKKGKRVSLPNAYDDIREAEVLCPLTPASAAAMRYVLSTPQSRLFAFDLCDPDDLRVFAVSAETYLLSHVGHGFDTLDFYHTMREPIKGTK